MTTTDIGLAVLSLIILTRPPRLVNRKQTRKAFVFQYTTITIKKQKRKKKLYKRGIQSLLLVCVELDQMALGHLGHSLSYYLGLIGFRRKSVWNVSLGDIFRDGNNWFGLWDNS